MIYWRYVIALHSGVIDLSPPPPLLRCDFAVLSPHCGYLWPPPLCCGIATTPTRYPLPSHCHVAAPPRRGVTASQFDGGGGASILSSSPFLVDMRHLIAIISTEQRVCLGGSRWDRVWEAKFIFKFWSCSLKSLLYIQEGIIWCLMKYRP